MTLSGYFMSKSVFGWRFLTKSVRVSKIIALKVTYIDPCYWRQNCRSMTLVSGNINYICRYSKAFVAGASSHRSGVVKIDEFAVFPLLCLRKFQKKTSALITLYTPFWISAATNKDDFEWPLSALYGRHAWRTYVVVSGMYFEIS